jgi:hypothetical protein
MQSELISGKIGDWFALVLGLGFQLVINKSGSVVAKTLK